jgi:NADH-quinone oxidoreductase subunit J
MELKRIGILSAARIYAVIMGVAGLLAGLIVGAIMMSAGLLSEKSKDNPILAGEGMGATKALGSLLFSKYVFGFDR